MNSWQPQPWWLTEPYGRVNGHVLWALLQSFPKLDIEEICEVLGWSRRTTIETITKLERISLLYRDPKSEHQITYDDQDHWIDISAVLSVAIQYHWPRVANGVVLGLFKKKQAVNPAELLYIDYFDKRYGSMYPHEVNVASVMQIHKELIDTFVSQKIPLRLSEDHNYFLDALERNRCPIHPAEFAVPKTVFLLTNKVPSDDGYEDEVRRLQAEGKIPKDTVQE